MTIEEPMACEVCGRERLKRRETPRPEKCARALIGGNTRSTECYRLGYTREHERAESLAKELAEAKAQTGRVFRDAAAWAGATPCPPWNSEDERSHYDTMADLCAAEIAERARAMGLPIEGFTWTAARRKAAASDWEDTIVERDAATARVAALEKQLAAGEASLDAELATRDRYHETADDLTATIAKHFAADFGEHSSGNDPWRRALDALNGDSRCAAEAELARLRALPDGLALERLNRIDAVLKEQAKEHQAEKRGKVYHRASIEKRAILPDEFLCRCVLCDFSRLPPPPSAQQQRSRPHRTQLADEEAAAPAQPEGAPLAPPSSPQARFIARLPLAKDAPGIDPDYDDPALAQPQEKK